MGQTESIKESRAFPPPGVKQNDPYLFSKALVLDATREYKKSSSGDEILVAPLLRQLQSKYLTELFRGRCECKMSDKFFSFAFINSGMFMLVSLKPKEILLHNKVFKCSAAPVPSQN